MRIDGFGLSAPARRPAALPKRGLKASPLTERRNFGANPGDLRMLFYAPPKLAPGAPLVVILHGCGQSAAAYDEGAGWTTLADRFGFAVLAPDQKSANNPGGCFNWFQPDDHARGAGEAASIRQMIAHAMTLRKLDPARIFVTGLSAGGAMAAALLAAYPDIFAGGAVIAGLPHGAAANMFEALTAMRRVSERTPQAWGDAVRKASDHSGPWPPLSVWHGDADSVVDAANAQALVAQWKDVHGISEEARAHQVDGQSRLVWHDGDGRAVVECYVLSGLAHGTPISTADDDKAVGKPGPFILDAGISSTFRIAEFWGLTATPAPAKSLLAAILPKVVPKPKFEPQPELRSEQSPEPQGVPLTDAERRDNKLLRVINRALEVAGLIKR